MSYRALLVFVWTILFVIQLIVVAYFQEGPLRGATFLYILPLLPGLLWSACVANNEVKALRRLIGWVFVLSAVEGLCGIATWAVTLMGLSLYEITTSQAFALRTSAVGWSLGGGLMNTLYSLAIRRLYPELDLKAVPRNSVGNGMTNG